MLDDQLIGKLYAQGKSSIEIAEHFKLKLGIKTTVRTITRHIKALGITRTRKEAKVNAIQSGRMVYYKKPDELKYKRKGLTLKLRMEVLTRDQFKCQLCGNTVKEGIRLELHHIKGMNNTKDNLMTLCNDCHKGIHYISK